MKSLAVLFMLLFASVCFGQEVGTLPDSPNPKPFEQMTKQEKDAYLNKKYPDLLQINKPVSSLKEAATGRGMFIFEGLFVASSIIDIIGTRHCIDNHTCREGNPVLGQSSRQQYTVTASLDTVVVLSGALLRKNQHGSMAIMMLWVPTTLHLVEGIKGLRQ